MTIGPGLIRKGILPMKRLLFNRRWLLVVGLSVFVHSVNASYARTWYLEKDGSGDYTVIQDAVDAAASGDTIRIGPGRYEEFSTVEYPAGLYDVCLNTTLGSLTVIGSGVSETTIFVNELGSGDYSAGIISRIQVEGQGLKVYDLTLEGGFYGAVAAAGYFMYQNCSMVSNHYGLRVFSATGDVSTCRFENIDGAGVGCFSNSHDCSVSQCTFINCGDYGFYFQASPNMTVTDCEFIGCTMGGFYDISSGSISRCTFDVATGGTGLGFEGNGVVSVTDCTISNARRNLFIVGASNVTFERNVFSPSTQESVLLSTCTPEFHNNHILPGGSYSVLLDGFPDHTQDTHLDFTNNYWGTTEPDSIAAWIWDGNDFQVPFQGIYAVVDYEPFSTVPLDTEKESLGGFKSMFK